MAAAFCLSAQVSAGPAAAQSTVHHAAVLDAANRPAPSPAQLTSATRRAAEQKPDSGLLAQYTVRPGDSLSAIAGRFYHNPDAWPVLYWANRSQIGWADDIQAGLVLRIPAAPARIPSAPTLLGPPAPQAPAAANDTSADTSPASAPVQAAPAQPAPAEAAPVQAAAAASTYSGATPGGSFGQCVVARESGGNAQVMNASGHYGLYQFSASTWAAYGGSPADFGHASVAEQNQVFASALAQGGQSNWSPYDGC
ncbi:MAG TPA: transglycosylase family protein [Streptosporangiaceae bacterium]|nr:transglycosylase family protein [Streptosporangiaceae bacterium]